MRPTHVPHHLSVRHPEFAGEGHATNITNLAYSVHNVPGLRGADHAPGCCLEEPTGIRCTRSTKNIELQAAQHLFVNVQYLQGLVMHMHHVYSLHDTRGCCGAGVLFALHDSSYVFTAASQVLVHCLSRMRW